MTLLGYADLFQDGHDGGFPGGYVPPYLPPPKPQEEPNPASRSTAKTPGNTRSNATRAETESGIKKESESTAGSSASVVGTQAMAKPAQTELPTRELKRKQSASSEDVEGFGRISKKLKMANDEGGEASVQGQSRTSSGYIPDMIKKLWRRRKSTVSSLGSPEGTKETAPPVSLNADRAPCAGPATGNFAPRIARQDLEDSIAGAKLLEMIKAAMAEDPALYEELIEGFADIARAEIIGKLSSLRPQS